MPRVNKTRFLVQDKKNYTRECKKLDNWGSCKKDYTQNSSTCDWNVINV